MKTDSQLQTDVMEELKWDPSVTHTNIGVAVNDGIVSLTGHVPTYWEKTAAEQAASRVTGVKAVVDDVVVKLVGISKRDDEDIAKAALNAIKWHTSVPDDIKVTVDDGCVTLRGEVNWDYQRLAAANAVKPLIGVVSVFNEIKIKETVQPTNIRSRIEEALKRTAEREAKKIAVDVRGHKVVLSGNVHSYAELEAARGAVWSAPGVTEVESHLQVAG